MVGVVLIRDPLTSRPCTNVEVDMLFDDRGDSGRALLFKNVLDEPVFTVLCLAMATSCHCVDLVSRTQVDFMDRTGEVGCPLVFG